MKLMRTMARGLALTLVVGVAGAAEVSPPQLDDHLAMFKPFVGKTWRGEFSRSTKERPIFDVSRWEVALKGKAIRITHSVNDGIYGGETIVMWDPDRKSVVAFYFTTAGFFTESQFESKDTKIHSREKVRGNTQGITEVEAVTELLPDGTMHVKSRYRKDDNWIDGHEITYRESPDSQVVLE